MEYGQYGFRRSGCNTGVEQKQHWLKQDTDRIPEGQDLRQHYHIVMQIAGTAAEGGMTDLYQAREISASRMANQRDKQALYDTYKERMHQHANMKLQAGGTQTLKRPMKIPDSPGIQATGNGQTQSKRVSRSRLHRNLGNPQSSLHTSTRMYGKMHKKPKSIHTASAGRLLPLTKKCTCIKKRLTQTPA